MLAGRNGQAHLLIHGYHPDLREHFLRCSFLHGGTLIYRRVPSRRSRWSSIRGRRRAISCLWQAVRGCQQLGTTRHVGDMDATQNGFTSPSSELSLSMYSYFDLICAFVNTVRMACPLYLKLFDARRESCAIEAVYFPNSTASKARSQLGLVCCMGCKGLITSTTVVEELSNISSI